MSHVFTATHLLFLLMFQLTTLQSELSDGSVSTPQLGSERLHFLYQLAKLNTHTHRHRQVVQYWLQKHNSSAAKWVKKDTCDDVVLSSISTGTSGGESGSSSWKKKHTHTHTTVSWINDSCLRHAWRAKFHYPRISLLHTASPELSAPDGGYVRTNSRRCFRTFRIFMRGVKTLSRHINEALFISLKLR